MRRPTSWVQVVGYRHEVVHTGVLVALFNDGRQAADIAAGLINRDAGSVSEIKNVKVEAKLPGAAGRADLTADLLLADGQDLHLAIETKVHSNGSRDQLERITGESENAEGILLALGLSSLKLTTRDTKLVSCEGCPRWHWVGPEDWLNVLEGVDASTKPWLPEYRAAIAEWRDKLGSKQRVELGHLHWMNELLSRIPQPLNWREIRTLQSGPVLSRFDWSDELGDTYLEFMGLQNGRRVLRLKVGGAKSSADLDRLAGRLDSGLRQLRRFEPGGRGGGRSRTVAETGDLGDDTEHDVLAASEAVDLLNDTIGCSNQ